MDINLHLEFFNRLQKACLPGIWSKGVSLARTGLIQADSLEDSEMIFRIQLVDRSIAPKVTLWPQDEDWFCDCNDRNDVCMHVAAVVAALKTDPGSLIAKKSNQTNIGKVDYRFKRNDGKLYLERWIVYGDRKGELLTGSLVAFVGGVTSGRLNFSPVSAVQSDFAVDSFLTLHTKGEFDRLAWINLFKVLADCSTISLDGSVVKVSAKPVQFQACLIDEESGFRLKMDHDPSISEIFKNGAVLCGSTLKGIEAFPLTSDERTLLSGEGKFFSCNEIRELMTEVLPSLKKKISIKILSQKLPELKQVKPKIVLRLEKSDSNDVLWVTPQYVYEDDLVKNSINNKENENTNPIPKEIIIYDPIEEQKLALQLRHELQLVPGQKVQFTGPDALNFVLNLEKWETQGNGVEAFTLHKDLIPNIHFDENSFEVSFSTPQGNKSVSFSKAFQAWRENLNYVPLLGGGWGELPSNWLDKYGARIFDILEAKGVNTKIHSYLIPEIVAFCHELDQPVLNSLESFSEKLINLKKIEEANLPADLSINLRRYQKEGVNWLCFLRNGKIGALLADDMGLGKTLQALCAIQGRTLIIAPTSVLPGWVEQICQYRPGLKYSVYYGNQRKIDLGVDVVVTTYALLRLNKESFSDIKWDSIILDEAQIIKNPESQIARAAYSLQGDFKIALTGTPIENRLEDLWSIFRVLNPGLLGTLEMFQEQFVSPIAKGDTLAAQKLRQRVRPFTLRRIKKDVAPELPPRIEKVLYSELNDNEKDVYSSILVSTRQEVIEKLEKGGSVFAALELLLRLRQACCHVSLVPGASSGTKVDVQSSKIELLIKTLEESLGSGHRALIFSQWTSYLDLIEDQLKRSRISFSRLDGATRNRDQVVAEFQLDSGPSVMLISLKAGGVGLTLTAADHVFIMDPWWNPAAENQAADRSHRIGQSNTVLIHRLVARGTIEERIVELKKIKQQIASSVLEEADIAKAITRDEILALLH